MKTLFLIAVSVVALSCSSTKVETANREIASEVTSITIKNSGIANQIVSTVSKNLIINGKVTDMNSYANGDSPVACLIIAFMPLKDGEVFKFVNTTYAPAKNFGDTNINFKNKHGMIGFSLVCHNKNFQVVDYEDVKMHFNNVIEFK